MPPKRKYLALDEPVEVVKLLESGKSSRFIVDKLGVGRTRIQNVCKRKRKIMEEYDSNSNPESKRVRRVTANDEINELCYKWFGDATSRQVNISGPLLQQIMGFSELLTN